MLRALTSFGLLTVYDSITVLSGQALYSQDCPHKNLNEGEKLQEDCARGPRRSQIESAVVLVGENGQGFWSFDARFK